MLNQNVYYVVAGYGDLFMVTPQIAACGVNHLVVPNNYLEVGIPKLMKKLFPRLNIKYCPWEDFHDRASGFTNLSDVHMGCLRRGNFENTISLPWDIVERIEPAPIDRDFIVVHPLSLGKERRYDKWGEVDLSGIKYKVVGAYNDPKLVPGEIELGDFLRVASLLRASKGLLCVDSCVMNLANILRVPTVTVYPKTAYYTRASMGVRLKNPSPEDVSKAARNLYAGEVPCRYGRD